MQRITIMLLLCCASMTLAGDDLLRRWYMARKNVPVAGGGGAPVDPYASTERVLCHFEQVDVPFANRSPDTGLFATNHANYNDTLFSEPLWTSLCPSPTNNGYSFSLNDNLLWSSSPTYGTTINSYTNDTTGSYSVWVNADKYDNYDTILCGTDAGAGFVSGIKLDVVSGKYRLLLQTDNTMQWTLTSAANAATGVWTHVAVAQNGTTPVLYVNGVAQAVTTNTSTDLNDWWLDIFTASAPVTWLELGDRPVVSGNGFDGKMDEFRVSTNFTAAYFLALYNNTNPTNRIWSQTP